MSPEVSTAIRAAILALIEDIKRHEIAIAELNAKLATLKVLPDEMKEGTSQ